jgi:hypothetical protein
MPLNLTSAVGGVNVGLPPNGIPDDRSHHLACYGAAWVDRAEELARWVMAHLANRLDAWGAYRPVEEIGREFTRRDGSKGKLGEQKTVWGRLTDYLLVRHFRARDRAHVIGSHTAGPDNLSKGGGIDIDCHGPTSTAPEVNLCAALHWYGRLVALGFRPLLLDSNGAGGFHLRLLLAEPIPADRLFHFLRGLTQDHRALGFDKAPEQFPKQADVRRCCKGLGNWLRLPGRHHKRDFWSRVWDGSTWLEGYNAINFMLSLTGDPPGLIPEVPPPPPAPPRPARNPFKMRAGGGGNLSNCIAAYMRYLPHLGEGQGRDDVAYRFTAFLVHKAGVSDDVALQWLALWDAENSPPKGHDRLVEILKNAHTYGRRQVGSGRGTAGCTHNGVQIIPAGRPGHYILRFRVEAS